MVEPSGRNVNKEVVLKRSRKVRRSDHEQDKPTRVEILSWYLYELCSHFIQTTLIPIVFPLIISQIVSSPPEPQGWTTSSRGFVCSQKEMLLYERLTHREIRVHNMKFSPLGWTSLSWALGLLLAAPILAFISVPLDHGNLQQLISGGATLLGALACLPAGFFRTVNIFPPYISLIIAAHVVTVASHTRHLALMARGLLSGPTKTQLFPLRTAVMGWFSLYGSALGTLGSAVIAAFTYHMLKESEQFISLWVVSIFSGLKWLVGAVHVALAFRPGAALSDDIPKTHFASVFRYPHAVGSLVVVLLSSFAATCVFTGTLLFVVGELCLKPVFLLYLLLIYFAFPAISLPLVQPLQHVLRADAVKMQLLGMFLMALVSGMGFYFRGGDWHRHVILIFGGVQGTAAGVSGSYGRVLLLNCAPEGKEGAFSGWYSWVRTVGACVGFAAGSACHGRIGDSLGMAFVAAVFGVLVLVFGNVSDIGGAVAAGNVLEEEDGDEEA